MSQEVELLSGSGNYAVVKLPGRSFPGVVFQADSLHILLTRLQAIQNAASEKQSSELQDICDELLEVQQYLEKVCKERGLKLSY
jgi:hypothetical protein